MILRPRVRPLSVLLAVGVASLAAWSPPNAAAAPPPALTKGDLIAPEELTKALALPDKDRPVILHVGPQTLYRSGHIPGARYAGQGSNGRGRAALQVALQGLSPSRAIVLYCGCCPWVNCPNVKPAYATARESGYHDVKVLFIAQDMKRDWVTPGRPWQAP